jgi:hypothetical protein
MNYTEMATGFYEIRSLAFHYGFYSFSISKMALCSLLFILLLIPVFSSDQQ